MNDQEYDYITRVIRKLTGIDLDNYKSQQMRRRLTGLIASQAGGVPEYCELVKKNKDALKKLRNFLTINVSEFFRDIEQFNILKTKVLPELLSRNPSLKVWSSGCSHGGEPYSIAILLEEIAPGRHHRVLGTDIDDETLARARAGGPYSAVFVRRRLQRGRKIPAEILYTLGRSILRFRPSKAQGRVEAPEPAER